MWNRNVLPFDISGKCLQGKITLIHISLEERSNIIAYNQGRIDFLSTMLLATSLVQNLKQELSKQCLITVSTTFIYHNLLSTNFTKIVCKQWPLYYSPKVILCKGFTDLFTLMNLYVLVTRVRFHCVQVWMQSDALFTLPDHFSSFNRYSCVGCAMQCTWSKGDARNKSRLL